MLAEQLVELGGLLGGEALGGIEVGFVRADADDGAREIEVRLVVATGGHVRLAPGEVGRGAHGGPRRARARGLDASGTTVSHS